MGARRCDETEAWGALRAHYDTRGRQFDLRTAFAADAERFAHFAVEAPGVFADLSKNRWDASTRALLTGLAAECGLEARRDAMFAVLVYGLWSFFVATSALPRAARIAEVPGQFVRARPERAMRENRHSPAREVEDVHRALGVRRQRERDAHRGRRRVG